MKVPTKPIPHYLPHLRHLSYMRRGIKIGAICLHFYPAEYL